MKVVEWPVAIALVLLAFAIIYFWAPAVQGKTWRWITRGTVAGVALWLIVSVALKIYLQYFGRLNATYGSLGAVIVLLLWFYLTGAAVLIGAEIDIVSKTAAAPPAHVNSEAAD